MSAMRGDRPVGQTDAIVVDRPRIAMTHSLDSAGYRLLLDLPRRIHDHGESEGADDGRDHANPAKPL
ncbi:hypothetical protein KEC55_22915 [Burkholderia cepacia]|uniref:hypothetical protein n=1 Tax=Burkholderia cepacia TaxID=292 RepID=UPI00249F6FD4|nr:hypothetical protein [Burkholderia cepacia]WGY72636.1 hypothetical protein KEC55_22915 [Burkholderia cepacia]